MNASVDLGKAQALRPFYFFVSVWGEQFRRWLLDCCIASLLAPGNIPSLLNRGNKFLIATTADDWCALQGEPMFELLARYVDPVLLEIPQPSHGVHGLVHMGVGHKLATQRAFDDKAYGILVTPDFMISDGAIAAVQRHAVDGVNVVLSLALRFAQEPLFENLERLGVWRRRDAGPLTVSGRQLAEAAIGSFHSESQRYEWDSSSFTDFPCACWWRVPGAKGIVAHGLSWGPLLMDYGALREHDNSSVESWTIDGNYVQRNFGETKIHVVQDSDELIQVSWTPQAADAQSLRPGLVKSLPWLGEVYKTGILRHVFFSSTYDSLKRRIFFLPVRWHASPVDSRWIAVEQRARSVIDAAVGDGATPIGLIAPRLKHALGLTMVIIARFAIVLAEQWKYRHRIVEVGARALRGDTSAWRRIRRRILIFSDQVRGDVSSERRR